MEHGNPTGNHILRMILSPQQLSMLTAQQKEGPGDPYPHLCQGFGWHDLAQVLCSSNGCCEFRSVIGMPCSEDAIPQLSSPLYSFPLLNLDGGGHGDSNRHSIYVGALSLVPNTFTS